MDSTEPRSESAAAGRRRRRSRVAATALNALALALGAVMVVSGLAIVAFYILVAAGLGNFGSNK